MLKYIQMEGRFSCSLRSIKDWGRWNLRIRPDPNPCTIWTLRVTAHVIDQRLKIIWPGKCRVDLEKHFKIAF